MIRNAIPLLCAMTFGAGAACHRPSAPTAPEAVESETAELSQPQRASSERPKEPRKRARHSGKRQAVIVNGAALDARTLAQLERAYRSSIRPGRYWYDAVSGLWGFEKGPAAGQIQSGLALGRLRSNASGGGTGIYLNGREIHPLERAYLVRLYGARNVRPGRYWMNARGIGGYEGGPAFFNLGASASSGRSMTGYSTTGAVLGGGGAVGYIDSDGRGVTCGPDGGCIY